jgi:polyferredoxin
MFKKIRRYSLSIGIFLFVSMLLIPVQLFIENRLLILDRFIDGGGWIEIFMIASYAGILIHKMKNPSQVARWRRISWGAFSVFFFSQLIIGVYGFDKFLMTGELHLPVPTMIISGPIYRGQFSIMTILFISTVLLTGPTWCSHLCYFGGMDNVAAYRRPTGKPWNRKFQVKHTFLFLIIVGTIILRSVHIHGFYALMGGLIIGIIGLILILTISTRTGRMANCTLFCPVGTLVMYLKYINPFRMYIDNSCTKCGICMSSCNYDALTMTDIENKKPGLTCTYCGDCISSCHNNSIRYKLFNLQPEKARKLYLFLTVSIHAVFMALAKI